METHVGLVEDQDDMAGVKPAVRADGARCLEDGGGRMDVGDDERGVAPADVAGAEPLRCWIFISKPLGGREGETRIKALGSARYALFDHQFSDGWIAPQCLDPLGPLGIN